MLYGVQQGHRVVSAGPETMTYDGDGNRTTDSERTYRYDALGRCVEIADAKSFAPIATFGYDPLGRRWTAGVAD